MNERRLASSPLLAGLVRLGLLLLVLSVLLAPPLGALRAAARPLTDALALALVVLAAAVLGHRLTRDEPAIDQAPAATALQVGLGMAVFALLALALALAHAFTTVGLGLLVVAPLALFGEDGRVVLARLRAWRPPAVRARPTVMLLAVFLVFLAVMALSPPLWVDELAYHLVIPQEYLRHGGITAHPETAFAFLPPLGSLLYGIVMALGSDFLPKQLHFVFFLLTLALLLQIVRKHLQPTAAALAALLFAAEWETYHAAQRADVDFIALFFATAALALLLDEVTEAPSLRRALVCGVFLGSAFACKYTALYPIGGCEAILAAAVLKRRVPLRHAIALNAAAFVVFAPVMLRNWIFTGDPLFYFLSSKLGDHRILSAAALDGVRRMNGLLHPRLTFSNFLLMPYYAYRYGRFPTVNFDGFIDPFYLISVPAGLLLLRRRRVLRWLYLYLAVFYVLWLSSAITRYALPAILVLSVLTAICVDDLVRAGSDERAGRLLRSLGVAAVVAYCVVNLLTFAARGSYFLTQNLGVYAGLTDRQTYLAPTPAHDLIAMESYLRWHHAALQDRVFMIFAEQVYYLRQPALADPLKTNLLDLRQQRDPVVWLRTHGYRYVVLDLSRYGWYQGDRRRTPAALNPYPDSLAFLESMWVYLWRDLAPRLVPVGRFGAHFLWRVPDAAPAVPSRVTMPAVPVRRLSVDAHRT